ncbi:MAG: 16S rRNA (cytosine(967)-C(5))-methyltransferase RsmB [Defluviitaleaceae bacterium]|nr:16S rRNA (cytosine(967)-C(5))-methyltransferase RsmB [Defluviitaleaceae bacterium]
MDKNNKNNERQIAFLALWDITHNGGYTNIVLRRVLADSPHLNRVQKAFVTEVVSGTIRNIMLLDHIIAHHSKAPLKKIKPKILNILRMSIYQLNFMDKVPTFAVCDEAVKLTKKCGLAPLAGFVNGILRNIKPLDEIPMPSIDGEPIEHLALKYSAQRWIVKHFVEELGIQEAVGVLEAASKGTSNITICVNTLKTTTQELQKTLESEGVVVSPTSLPNVLQISKTSDISQLDSFKAGLYHVMDFSAVMATHIASPAIKSKIIDICAAPGGKSFALAYGGHDVLSRDVHPHKIKLLDEGVARLGLEGVATQLACGTVFDKTLETTADLLVIDAPCSGLGTLGRKADIKLRKEEEGLEVLAQLTKEIIQSSYKYLKIGGKMLFCTCTISKAENIDNFNWILENLPFKPVDFSDKLALDTAREGYVQLLPRHFNSEGFFISLLERVK